MHALLFEWKAVRGESVNEHGEWLMNTELTPAMADYLRRQPGCEVEAAESFACDMTAGTLKSATG